MHVYSLKYDGWNINSYLRLLNDRLLHVCPQKTICFLWQAPLWSPSFGTKCVMIGARSPGFITYEVVKSQHLWIWVLGGGRSCLKFLGFDREILLVATAKTKHPRKPTESVCFFVFCNYIFQNENILNLGSTSPSPGRFKERLVKCLENLFQQGSWRSMHP